MGLSFVLKENIHSIYRTKSAEERRIRKYSVMFE